MNAPDWIAATPASGAGNADVTLTVTPFSDLYERLRNGLVTIGGRTVSVQQTGPPSSWWNRPIDLAKWPGESRRVIAAYPAYGTRLSDDGRVLVTGLHILVQDPVAGPVDLRDLVVADTATGQVRSLGLPAKGYMSPVVEQVTQDGSLLHFSWNTYGVTALAEFATAAVTPLEPPDGSLPVFMDGDASHFVTTKDGANLGTVGVWDRAANRIVASLPRSFSAAGESRWRSPIAFSLDGSTVLFAVEKAVAPGAPRQSRPTERWRWQAGTFSEVPIPAGVTSLIVGCGSSDIGASAQGSLNADGTRVLFAVKVGCAGTSTDSLPLVHLYLHDSVTGGTRLITTTPNGQPSTTGASSFSFDRLGRYVAFASTATDLIAETPPADGLLRVYRYDHVSGQVERVRVRELEGGIPPYPSNVVLSGDGQHIAHDKGLFTRGHPIAGLGFSSVVPEVGNARVVNDVELVGSGFTPGLRVFFGQTEIDGVEVLSASRAKARLPATYWAQVADVRLIAPGGRTAGSDEALRFADCSEALWQLGVVPPATLFAGSTVTLASSTGGTVALSVTTTSTCGWTIEVNPGADWMTVAAAAGTGNREVVVSVAPLPAGTAWRSAPLSLRVNGALYRSVMLQQAPTPACAFEVTPASLTAPGEGGTLSVSVQTSAGCGWTVENLPSWITAQPMSGQGSGTVALTVLPWVGGNRLENLRVGGRWVSVSQAGLSCTYTMTPSSVTVPAAGGQGSFLVTASNALCGTTFVSKEPWLTLDNAGGKGSWTVQYSAIPNPTSVTRNLLLTTSPAASAFLWVYQNGRDCIESVSPRAIDAPVAGGTFTIDVVTLPGLCNWQASFPTGFSFVGFASAPSGTTTGRVTITVGRNAGAARATTLRVASQFPNDVTISQAGTTDPGGEPTPGATGLASYLAEGATSSFFDTRVALLNSGDSPASAVLTFSRVGASPVTLNVDVPARTRRTLDPKTVSGLGSAEFSTRVDSSQPLIVDRTMTWDGVQRYGAHAETAVAALARTWYLAEGATHSGFSLFYLLQNPGATAAEVRVRYLRPSGAPLEKTYTLPPTSRTNIWVNVEEFPGLGPALAATDVSAVIEVTNAVPVIVERAMYRDGPGQTFGAGHASAGITAPATEWFLAEGATGPYFDLFVLVANPNATEAQVEATYLLSDGTSFTKPYAVPGNSRFNIWVDYDDARLADTAVSTTIRSTNGVPVIVERAMWWPGGGWYEAHNSPGATTTGTKWAVAEGEVDAARNLETYILVANTGATPADVKVTLLFEDGRSVERTFTGIAARSRFNVPVGGFFPEAAGQRFGAIVESVGATPAPIVVERAMYWDAAGQTWAAGTNALATKLR